MEGTKYMNIDVFVTWRNNVSHDELISKIIQLIEENEGEIAGGFTPCNEEGESIKVNFNN